MQSALDWEIPVAYPAVIERVEDQIVWWFPDLPELKGTIEDGASSIEHLSGLLIEALERRKLRRSHIPFASRVSSLDGDVMMIPTVIQGRGLMEAMED